MLELVNCVILVIEVGCMFNSPNPSSTKDAILEIEELERQADERKDDFPFIKLTCSELRLLKSAAKEWAKITDTNKSSANRLCNLNLIRILHIKNAGKETIEICEIRTRGINYLQYLSGEKSEKRSDHLHDWWIAIVSALIGAFLSEPMWTVLHQLADLFQNK